MVHPIGKRFFKIMVLPYIKKVNGLANIPKDRNFIIAANHSSYMDHLILATIFVNYVNKRMHFLAKKEHFEGFFQKSFHKWADAIPIDRQAGGKEALKWAINALKNNKIISIYPEGTRTLNGRIQKGKTGVARLVLGAKVPVLPIGLIGTFEMLQKGKHIPKFKRATVNNHKILRKVTDEIMEEIAKLSNQKYNY